MTEEQIKTKAKEQFPNDEFKQQIVIDAINWATKELQEEIATLKHNKKTVAHLGNCIEEIQDKKITDLEAQLEQEKNLSQCRFDHNEQLRGMIEKMRNCANCNYFVSKKEGWVCEKGSVYQFCIGKNCTDWKLKEQQKSKITNSLILLLRRKLK